MRTNQPAPTEPGKRLTYPETRRDDIVDNFFGTKVPDPYRWLEDPDSAETQAWVTAQNKLTQYYLNQIPARDLIRKQLDKLYNYEKFGIPTKLGGRYFYTRNDGLQNQDVLYWTDSLTGRPELLLDPNTLSTDGTVSLGSYIVSWDGRYMAYGLSDGGSDWRTWHIRNIDTGADLPDKLDWVKFVDVSWLPSSQGFYYGRYPETQNKLEATNENHKIYFHKLNTAQADDQLVYERKDQPDWLMAPVVTEDGSTLLLVIYQGTENKNRVYYKDLRDPNSNVVPLLDDFDAAYQYLGNEGSKFWFDTTLNAPNRRVIMIDLAKPDKKSWAEVIPQQPETIESSSMVGKHFIINYLKDAHSFVRIFNEDGTEAGELQLPSIGTATGFSGNIDDTETFYQFTGFTTPPTVYHYDIKAAANSVFRRPNVDFDPLQFETKQIFYTSKDGTKVPMFIVYKKGIQLDGSNPTLLYGYGGFDISLTPTFSTSRTVWMEMGGVFALANIRGGGEYGEEWHLAGTKEHKQNVFDDFIAGAEWLIQNGYTNPKKLAIQGGSNGGLLMGAVLEQRPDLFRAALVQNGVLDMLRYQKFTIGRYWASDYGTVDEPNMFKVLYSYSPVHNALPGKSYPAAMVTTADHDDRVVPGHSYKFTAALQRAQAMDNPILIRIQTRAGHGAGTPTSIALDEIADLWAFLTHELGMQVKF
ncbi:S9 family peptidase [Candidatus Acetothermia bacterium]|nr:S9 family peptidase [Candidatus Acetothermia bacterium]MBI3643009.1 S9 family peptidase [Candidatus Acetothermia bacterium]